MTRVASCLLAALVLGASARAQVVGELIRPPASETLPAIAGLDPASPAGVAFVAGWEEYADLRVADAVPHWRRAVDLADAPPPGLRAWLAEALRRAGQTEPVDSVALAEAVAVARGVIDDDACHAHAHHVLGDALNPQFADWPAADADAAWHHMQRAVACDPDDGNAWMSVWVEAYTRGDAEAAGRALRAQRRIGFWTPPTLAFARWTLANAPPDAILLTNGDGDTLPMEIVRHAEGFRPDVAIVNVSLLDVPAVARRVAEEEGLPLFESIEIYAPRYHKRGSTDTPEGRIYSLRDHMIDLWLAAWADGTLDRPIVATITIDPAILGTKTEVVDQGALLAPDEVTWFDAWAARDAFEGLDGGAFRGPLAHPAERSAVRLAFPFDPGALVLFQMLQTAVSFAQVDDPETAETVYADAITFAQAAGRPDDPLIVTAREWIDEAGESGEQ